MTYAIDDPKYLHEPEAPTLSKPVLKLCTLCKHYKKVKRIDCSTNNSLWYWNEGCEAWIGQPSPVDGRLISGTIECSIMRFGPCGLDAKLYVANQSLGTERTK